MNLLKVHGTWTGTVKPVITKIDITQKGQYDFEEDIKNVYTAGVNSVDSIVFSQDGTWSFFVSHDSINTQGYTYMEFFSQENVKVVVTYQDAIGTVNTVDAAVTVSSGVSSKGSFPLGTAGCKYQVVVDDGMDIRTFIEVTAVPGRGEYVRPGDKVITYVNWEQMDSQNLTVLSSGLIKKEVILESYQATAEETGENVIIVQEFAMPGVTTRFHVYSLVYNENDADWLADVIPKNDSELLSCSSKWVMTETHYVRKIPQATYNSSWSVAEGNPTRVDPYRIACSNSSDYRTYAAMTNPDNVCYAYTDSDGSDILNWDAAVFTKVFAGPNGCVAIKTDGSLLTMGQGEVITYLQYGAAVENISKIALGRYHAAILKADGTVVHRGNPSGTWYSAADAWTDIVDIAVGVNWTIGVKSNGTSVIVRANANYPNGYADISSVSVKKIYSVDEYSFAYIDSSDKLYIAGTYTGDYGSVGRMRTAIASWPSSIEHIVCSNYYMYGFSKDSMVKQVWCVDEQLQDTVKDWGHIVGAALFGPYLIAVRCDGQIVTNSYATTDIGGTNKSGSKPWLWSAKELAIP